MKRLKRFFRISKLVQWRIERRFRHSYNVIKFVIGILFLLALVPLIKFGGILFRWNTKHALVALLVFLIAYLITKV